MKSNVTETGRVVTPTPSTQEMGRGSLNIAEMLVDKIVTGIGNDPLKGMRKLEMVEIVSEVFPRPVMFNKAMTVFHVSGSRVGEVKADGFLVMIKQLARIFAPTQVVDAATCIALVAKELGWIHRASPETVGFTPLTDEEKKVCGGLLAAVGFEGFVDDLKGIDTIPTERRIAALDALFSADI